MAAPTYTPQLATILQGLTSQQLAALAATGGSVQNSSSVVAPGSPNPEDARPGYLAAGQPGGNPSNVLVPGGQYNTDPQIQLIGSPAGTSGGGGIYPNISGASAVPNPMVSSGWTVQTNTGDVEQEFDISGPEFVTGVHGTAITPATYVPEGGTSTYTWSIVGTTPTGVTIPGGVLTCSTGTSAGTYSFQVKVVDSSSSPKTALKNVILTLS